MPPYWMAVLGCLFILAHTTTVALPAAAVPSDSVKETQAPTKETQGPAIHVSSVSETLVVTKVNADDEQASTSPVTDGPSETTSHQPELTTDEPNPPIKLKEMDVRSEVTMRYAHTAVVTKVRNPAKRAQEATFRVLLPETAFISGFTMILDGKPYKAYVKEKAEAKKIYTDAVAQGQGAAHIAAKARDSNHFTVSVNVEPNTTAVFNLTYEELLVRRNNVYNHAINLHPGALVPKLTVTVHIKEVQKITDLRVPEVRTGNEVDATDSDAQNSKAVIERGHDDREATVSFSPDLDEQRRLMDVYAQKTKESQAQSSSYSYGWYGQQPEETKQEGVLGQFVVQYDVDRPKDGEILVNDGYFVHFFAPSSLPPLNKHVVFVLDTSGSMMNRKIEQLRQAMQTILGELNSGDYFNIVEFASTVTVHELKEADMEPTKSSPYNFYYESEDKPYTLVPPSQATPHNVAKAKTIVSRLNANGGTNIASALNVAVTLIQKGVGWTPEPVNATAAKPNSNETPKGDNDVTTTALPASTSANPKETDNAKPAEAKDDGKKLEPIIIFLTDGDPTVGLSDPVKIVNRVTEKNSGPNRASIFSLAFGEDADRSFLRKISLRNEGFMRHIYEAADAALQLRDFYRQVSSPLLANLHFAYPADQIKEGSLTKNKFRTFYAGSETVVAGRVADGGSELAPSVYAICGVVDDGFTRKKYEIFPKVPTARPRDFYLPLERLWAYLTIKQLLDEKDSAVETHADDLDNKDTKKKDDPEKKALEIALKYEFVTPLTSLVVVKPNATNAVDAESVDKLNNGPTANGYGGALPLAAFSFSQGAPSAGNSVAAVAFDSLPVPIYDEAEEDLSIAPQSADYQVDSGQPMAASSYASINSNNRILLAGPPQSHRLSATSAVDIRVSAQLPPSSSGAPEATFIPGSFPTSVSSTPAPSRLAQLELSSYTWVESLLRPDSNIIVLEVPNNSTVELELIRSSKAPLEPSGDAECARATDGAAGVCVYLTRCDAAKDITAAQYNDTYCKVDNKFAGVCCPRAQVDLNIS